MNLDTFRRFVKPGAVFGYNRPFEPGLLANRLVAIHDDCIECVNSVGDTELLPHSVIADSRIVFGPHCERQFAEPERHPFASMFEDDDDDAPKPALSPEEIAQIMRESA